MTSEKPVVPARSRSLGRYAIRVFRAVTAMLVVTFLIAWFVLETDVAAERVRLFLEGRGSSLLGTPIRIDRLQLDVVPPRLEMHGLRIGTAQEPTMLADRVRVELGAVELLGRQLAVENLEMDRPRLAVSLDIGSNGAGGGFETPFDLRIHRALIRDGTVVLGDANAGVEGELLGIFLRLDPEGVSRLGLGSGRGSGQLRIADGHLDLTARNRSSSLLTPLEFDVSYGTRPRAVEIDSAQLNIGESHLVAQGTLRGLRDVDLELIGDLALLDILKVWVPPGDLDHDGRVRYRGTLQVRDGAAVVAGRVNASSTRFMGLDIESFASDLQIRRGFFALRNVEVALFGGSANGSIEVDSTFEPSRIQAQYVARGIDAASFTNWELLPGLRLAGRLDASGTLEWQQPFTTTATGSGQVELSVRDVNAVSPSTAPRRSGAAVGAGPVPSLPLPGEISARYELGDGELRLDRADLVLPGAAMSFAGAVDFDGDLDISASLTAGDLRIIDHVVAQVRRLTAGPADRLGLRGSGSAELRLVGTRSAPVLTGTVRTQQLAVTDIRFGDASATLRGVPGFVTLERLRLDRESGSATGRAEIRFPGYDSVGVGARPDYSAQLLLRAFPASFDLQLGGPEFAVRALANGNLTLAGRFDSTPTGAFDLSGDATTLGPASLDTFVLRGRKAETAWLFDEAVVTRGPGRIDAAGMYGASSGELNLEAAISRFALAEVAGWTGAATSVGGALDARVTLSGPLDRLSGEGAATWSESSIGQVFLGNVALSLRADQGIVATRLVGTGDSMPDPPGVARTTVAEATPLPQPPPGGWAASASTDTSRPFATSARLSASAEVARALMAPLGWELPDDLTLQGYVTADVSGPLANLADLRGTANVEGLTVARGNFRASANSFLAVLEANELRLEGTLTTTRGDLRVSPRVDLADGSLKGRIEGPVAGSVVQLFDPGVQGAGTLRVEAELGGDVDRPVAFGSIAVSDLDLNNETWPYALTIDEVDLGLDGDRLRISALQGAFGGRPLNVQGELAFAALADPEADVASRLEVAVESLPLAPLLALSPGVNKLVDGGTFSGVVRLEGAGTDPRRWTGTFQFDELELRMQQYRTALAQPTTATIGDGVLTMGADARFTGGRTDFGLTGTIALDPVRLDLNANGRLGFEVLNVLSPYWGTGGFATVDLRVYGDVVDLAYQGTAALQNVVLSPPPLRQPIESISAQLQFQDRRISIRDLRGELGGGDVTGGGEVFLRNNAPQSFRLDTRVDNALLRLERDVRFTASADLVYDGTPERSILSGSVHLVDALYRREYTADRAILEMLESPETDPDPFLSSISLVIAVEGNEDLFIDNNLADVEVTADFDVRGTLARPVVLGRASILSGRLFWNGNNFEVLQGNVDFNNPFETEPTFEIRARTEIRRYTIDMRFSGSLIRGVDFDYSSTPTLSDLELFNLLAFGEEPGSETLQDPRRYQQALGLQATRYLTDAYFSEVERGAQRLFGVDRFRISPTLTGNETDATARLTLGKRINRNLYLTYSRLLSSSEDQLITVEYQLSPKVRIKGTRDEDGSFGIDFLVQQRIRR